MRGHRELRVQGSEQRLRRIPDAIERKLTTGWERKRDREESLRRNSGAELFNFQWLGNDRLSAADVWLALHGDELRVSNIVPAPPKSELSYAEYNGILERFARDYVTPLADEMGVTATLTNPEIRIHELLPRDVADALVQFSRLANGRSGASHPWDKQRWEAFVIGAHRADSELDAGTLSRWLTEEEKWDPEAAQDLAMEYEQARSILGEYDRQLQNA
jgi:hypothetical protein